MTEYGATRIHEAGHVALRLLAEEMAENGGVLDLFEAVLIETARLGADHTPTKYGVTVYWNDNSEASIRLDQSGGRSGLVIGCREGAAAKLERDGFRAVPIRRFRYNWKGISVHSNEQAEHLIRVVLSERERR